MELLLPLFTKDTKMLSSTFGVNERDGIVTYIHSGMPVASHTSGDLKKFRYHTARFVTLGLFRQSDVVRIFGVSEDSVRESIKIFEEKGEEGFFEKGQKQRVCPAMLPERIERIQKMLDKGMSNYSIGKKEGISEGTIRYALQTGKLVKKVTFSAESTTLLSSSTPTNRSERSQEDLSTASGLGIATTRTEERVMAATGLLTEAPTIFQASNSVMNAGVLFSLPTLLGQGLLKAITVYEPLKKGYYNLTHIILLLAFMAMARIKNPEQLKKYSPGEMGKFMGLDRSPEVSCFREKIGNIVSQYKTDKFGQLLSKEWITNEECLFFYIDGHVRVYSGYLANLPKKYVSRQKLCLPGTTEFWVNDQRGLPFMVFTGELNEKLKDAILHVIPTLIEETASLVSEKDLAEDPDLPRFTLVFDREAYEPSFFEMLWKTYRIAVITYRKNVKDKWDENEFYKIETQVISKNISMLICEHETRLSGYAFREIRKLSDHGHQTSMITTNKKIDTATVAGKMFSRWSEENFFRYLIAEFNFDKMIQYGVESVNQELSIVNPEYSQISYLIKKQREKKSRVDASLLAVMEKNIEETNLSKSGQYLKEQAELKEKQNEIIDKINQLLKNREQMPARIKVKDMAEEVRYNKLKLESKMFMNTIKMIAYRTETLLANMIAPYFNRAEDEIRQLIQQIMQSDADLLPDYHKNTLTITLHTLSTPRANQAAKELCAILNETQTIYPQTNLVMIYKTYFEGNING